MSIFALFDSEWLSMGKLIALLLTMLGTLLTAVLGFWKGFLPWLKKQWDEDRARLAASVESNRLQLANEISEARRERDDQRALRADELKMFMRELRAQRKLHEKGFAMIVEKIEGASREKTRAGR